MKKLYKELDLEVVRFGAADIITTSDAATTDEQTTTEETTTEQTPAEETATMK